MVGTDIAPTAVVVATGKSDATKGTEPVINPLLLNVIPDLVVPVIVLLIEIAPKLLTVRPPAVGTLTPPTAEVVASGISLATNAAVDVISPSLLYVIPFLADAPLLLRYLFLNYLMIHLMTCQY